MKSCLFKKLRVPVSIQYFSPVPFLKVGTCDKGYTTSISHLMPDFVARFRRSRGNGYNARAKASADIAILQEGLIHDILFVLARLNLTCLESVVADFHRPNKIRQITTCIAASSGFFSTVAATSTTDFSKPGV